MDFRKNGSAEVKKIEEYPGYGDARGCSVFEQMQIGMAIVSSTGKWLRVNSRLCGMLGYTESELLEMDFKKLAHPDKPEPDFELRAESFGPLNEKQLKYLSNISTSGRHLLKLINGILDLSKIEAGNMELHLEEFSIPAAFEEVKMTLSPMALRKNVRITDYLDKEMEMIRADRTKFKQILYNLMDNATKFTPENGLITIDARAAGENMLVRIADSGPGISGEGRKKLFQPFTQLGKFESREQPGTGLGLALVRKFVEMHGGRVWVESEIGKGSVFTFMIPLKQE